MSHEGSWKSAEQGPESDKQVSERAEPWSLWRAWLFLAVASFALWCVIGVGVMTLL